MITIRDFQKYADPRSPEENSLLRRNAAMTYYVDDESESGPDLGNLNEMQLRRRYDWLHLKRNHAPDSAKDAWTQLLIAVEGEFEKKGIDF
jgi:hypothetical protein